MQKSKLVKEEPFSAKTEQKHPLKINHTELKKSFNKYYNKSKHNTSPIKKYANYSHHSFLVKNNKRKQSLHLITV